MRRVLGVVLAAALLTGCQRTPESVDPVTSVERLFTIDDCTVFRFHDFGRVFHFVHCQHGSVAIAR